jgi:urea transporter
MTAVKDMLAREPVRVYLYTIISAVIGLLVVFGILDESMVLPIMAVVSAVLAVPLVESLRSRVTPTDPKV